MRGLFTLSTVVYESGLDRRGSRELHLLTSSVAYQVNTELSDTHMHTHTQNIHIHISTHTFAHAHTHCHVVHSQLKKAMERFAIQGEIEVAITNFRNR